MLFKPIPFRRLKQHQSHKTLILNLVQTKPIQIKRKKGRLIKSLNTPLDIRKQHRIQQILKLDSVGTNENDGNLWLKSPELSFYITIVPQ